MTDQASLLNQLRLERDEPVARAFGDLFFFVTYVVCAIMAAGALVGALNTPP